MVTLAGGRMSSRAVRLGALGALSLSLVACGGDPEPDEVTAYCVSGESLQDTDGSYEVVDEDNCGDDDGTRAGGVGFLPFFFFYGGSLRGNRISGGSTVRPQGARITTPKGRQIQRGGLGGRGTTGS